MNGFAGVADIGNNPIIIALEVNPLCAQDFSTS
jgi:hypothetical protein